MEKFPNKISCAKCKKPITGWVYYQNGNIFDSSGFIPFDDGYQCDKCIIGGDPEFESELANEK
jgi:hypothetical protein